MHQRINTSRLFSIFLVMIMAITVANAQNESGAILGTWKTDEGLVVVKSENNLLEGTTTTKKGETVKVLKQLKYADGLWSGEVYAPKRKKYYPVKCRLLKNGNLELKVRAGMISRTLTWTRHKSIDN